MQYLLFASAQTEHTTPSSFVNPIFAEAPFAMFAKCHICEKKITLVSVHRLKYLLARLNETAQFYRPVTNGMPRITPREGATIGGYSVLGDVSFNSFLSTISFQSLDGEHCLSSM